MPTSTQTDATLKITLTEGIAAPVEFGCQIIGAEFTQPAAGEGEVVPTACGDTVVEPGDVQPGSLTGEVYKDTSESGITRALAAAVQAGTVFDYTYTENEGTATELQFTGKATVRPFGVSFTPNKYGRHPLELSIATATLAPAHVTP